MLYTLLIITINYPFRSLLCVVVLQVLFLGFLRVDNPLPDKSAAQLVFLQPVQILVVETDTDGRYDVN